MIIVLCYRFSVTRDVGLVGKSDYGPSDKAWRLNELFIVFCYRFSVTRDVGSIGMSVIMDPMANKPNNNWFSHRKLLDFLDRIIDRIVDENLEWKTQKTCKGPQVLVHTESEQHIYVRRLL